MKESPMLKRVLAIHSVPAHIVGLTLLASVGAAALGVVQGWPLWARAFAALLPWIPVFTGEIVWTYRHYQWLSLFYVLAVTQSGHFLEHVAQMAQIHILGLVGPNARGVFGTLDLEWVHFIWNTWVIAAVVLLVWRFRTNPWLWVTALLAGWHEVEHLVIMSAYLSTGQVGTPGLLAHGGLIGGGLPLSRPDLHFFYNLVETIPLVGAFVYQLKRSHDEWLKKAFPAVPQPILTELTRRLQIVRCAAGETILRQGDRPDRFYIVARGEVAVTRRGESGQEVEVSVLSAGQYFGEIGLFSGAPRTVSVRARTSVELLVLDRETFQKLIESSGTTAHELAEAVS
jgi:hypothetical protein